MDKQLPFNHFFVRPMHCIKEIDRVPALVYNYFIDRKDFLKCKDMNWMKAINC